MKYNAKYKNINYNIVDEKSGQELQVYAGLGLNGADFKALTDLKVGQVVVICGKLTTFNGTKQVDKNSKIISITGEGEAPAPDETVGDLTAPNGNFEAWVNGQPNNWATASTAGNATLKQSTDAHSGKYAVEVTHVASGNKRIGYKEIALKAGEYTITWRYDIESFLYYYGSFISLAGMERITGINQKQLWAYMHGRKKPRQAQKEKITNALHRFARELAAAVIL